MTRYTLLALATVCVLGVSGAVPGVHSASRDDAPTLTRTVVLDGLDDPWDLAFTPDGALLVTEKCRGLSVRRADGTWHILFGHNGAAGAAPDFFCQGQSGAHGIAVDPDFARIRFVRAPTPYRALWLPSRWGWGLPARPAPHALAGRAPEWSCGPLRHGEPSPLPRPTCAGALRGYRLVGNDRVWPAQPPPKGMVGSLDLRVAAITLR